MPFKTFEDHYDEIAQVVEKFRSKWTFKASVMRDFEDIKSEILTHIWKKWHLYDQKLPVGAWAFKITKNQFSNILRNTYLSTSAPCSKCPCNTGGDTCSIFGRQGIECPLYKKWYYTRRHCHYARLPVSIEEHLDKINERPDNIFDIESAITNLHAKMKATLTISEWAIYNRLYIEGKNDDQIAKELGFKTTEAGRKIGYKRIRQVKTIIFQKARKIMAEEGVETL